MSGSLPRRRALLAGSLGLALIASCDPYEPSSSGGSDGSGDPPDRPGAAISARVLNPRLTPRSAFALRLEAEPLGGDAFVLIASLRSPRGGPGRIEYSFTEGVRVIDGSPARAFDLGPGEIREERIAVLVPPAGERAVAVTGAVGERQEEAYVLFGDPPSPENLGLRVRRREAGDGILRFDADGPAR